MESSPSDIPTTRLIIDEKSPPQKNKLRQSTPSNEQNILNDHSIVDENPPQKTKSRQKN